MNTTITSTATQSPPAPGLYPLMLISTRNGAVVLKTADDVTLLMAKGQSCTKASIGEEVALSRAELIPFTGTLILYVGA